MRDCFLQNNGQVLAHTLLQCSCQCQGLRGTACCKTQVEGDDDVMAGGFDPTHLSAEVDGMLISAKEVDRRLEQFARRRLEQQISIKEGDNTRPAIEVPQKAES